MTIPNTAGVQCELNKNGHTHHYLLYKDNTQCHRGVDLSSPCDYCQKGKWGSGASVCKACAS
jgi:hypothetical protein